MANIFIHKPPYRQISWSLDAARLDIADVALKYQSDLKSPNPNLVALTLHEILR